MLALVASIHVLNTTLMSKDVDGRDKPDHDGRAASCIIRSGEFHDDGVDGE